jgi:membrane protein
MNITYIKNLAFVAMLIDHIAILAPSIPIHLFMRGIGRMAFVIFGFLIAYNYIYKDESKINNKLLENKQLQWLGVFSIISEIPYLLYLLSTNNKESIWNIVFNPESYQTIHAPLNIFVTLFLAALCIIQFILCKNNIWLKSSSNFTTKLKQSWKLIVLLIISVIISYFVDYGITGFLYIVFTYLALSPNIQKHIHNNIYKIIMIVINIVLGVLINIPLIKSYTEFLQEKHISLYPIWMVILFAVITPLYLIIKTYLSSNKQKPNKQISKNSLGKKIFFYSFYAIHLLFIVAVIETIK